MEIKNRTIALLIDSDNISRKYLELLLNEVSKFGEITYKRIYGDFTTQQAAGWRKDLIEYAIEPIQQYLLTKKKKDGDKEIEFNVTDSAMIIDAMDILYTKNVDCVCLATSDSDFTKLAMRFRNENYVVIGAGEKKTSQSFRAACHRFLLMDALLAESEKSMTDEEGLVNKEVPLQETKKKGDCTEALPEDAETENTPMSLGKLVDVSKKIIREEANEDGWVLMSRFSQRLYDQVNTFNPKLYGNYSKPTLFFRSLIYTENKKPIFELKKVGKVDSIRIVS